MRFIDAPFYVRQMIVVSFIFTFVLAIIGLFASVRLCKKRRYIVLPAVTFALSFLSVFLTMCGSKLYRVGESVFEPSLTIISLPLWLHCVVAVVLLALAIYGLVSAVLWKKKHISPVSIKESADTLPVGICFLGCVIVTLPFFSLCLNWWWSPSQAISNQPSALSILITSLEE